MLRIVFIVVASAFALVTGPSFAQSAKSAKPLGEHGKWGSYSYDSGKGKVCYVLSVPVKSDPAGLDHGKIYFFVTQRPGQNVSYEPQFAAGYNLQDGSKVVATIGGKSFDMMTKGTFAWLENAAEEPRLVQEMKAGATMSVKAVSGRGNNTSYQFSLSGISSALSSISGCK